MQRYRLRTDLERAVIDGFALPLGFAPPPGTLKTPVQGYTVSYATGEEDEPDTYTFYVVVSHERLAPLILAALRFLPDAVFAIVDVASRDAYRTTDTFISAEPLALDDFLRVWRDYESFLLEDGSIAAGANSEEPFVEVFVDQWKGLAIHVPPSMRDDVESMLRKAGLEEVAQTWPDVEPADMLAEEEISHIRQVLDLSEEDSPDLDELLLDLRHDWNLELNIDPESNIDEGGRDLGSTLWHAVVIVDGLPHATGNGDSKKQADGSASAGGYASIWATAISLNEMEHLIQDALSKSPTWTFGEIYTIDRVAFDERPDELADLRPSRRASQVHLMTIEPWGEPEKER